MEPTRQIPEDGSGAMTSPGFSGPLPGKKYPPMPTPMPIVDPGMQFGPFPGGHKEHNLLARIVALEYMLQNHKHTGTDRTQKLEAATGAEVYGGTVAANGTEVALPTGWSSAKNATGSYTVTHNLGHTDYAVTVSPASNSLRVAQIGSGHPEADEFDVFTFKTDTLAQEDLRFTFILVVTA